MNKDELKIKLKTIKEELENVKYVRGMYAQGLTQKFVPITEEKRLEKEFYKFANQYKRLCKG